MFSSISCDTFTYPSLCSGIPSVGRESARALLAHFGDSLPALARASESDLLAVRGVGPATVAAVRAYFSEEEDEARGPGRALLRRLVELRVRAAAGPSLAASTAPEKGTGPVSTGSSSAVDLPIGGINARITVDSDSEAFSSPSSASSSLPLSLPSSSVSSAGRALCAGKSFVLTGAFRASRTERARVAAFVRHCGGRVQTAVTLATDIVIVGGGNGGEAAGTSGGESSKLKAARERNVKVMDEAEFARAAGLDAAWRPAPEL